MAQISGASRVYRGVTGEKRVAERRRKLIEAGMDLFGSRNSESVRVKDVCAESGLTERYFYENFSDLNALFEAVVEHTKMAVDREIWKAVEAADDDSVARITVSLRKSVEVLAADPRKIHILFVAALSWGGQAARRRHEFTVEAAENFFKWSGTDPGAFRATPVEARMKAIALAGLASELLIAWAQGLVDMEPTQLADFLVAMYWRISLS